MTNVPNDNVKFPNIEITSRKARIRDFKRVGEVSEIERMSAANE